MLLGPDPCAIEGLRTTVRGHIFRCLLLGGLHQPQQSFLGEYVPVTVVRRFPNKSKDLLYYLEDDKCRDGFDLKGLRDVGLRLGIHLDADVSRTTL